MYALAGPSPSLDATALFPFLDALGSPERAFNYSLSFALAIYANSMIWSYNALLTK